MIKVLFVCLGNICRSPVAEGIFAKLVRERGVGGRILCDSCGTSNYHIGGSPDLRSSENAQKNGLVLKHKARQFSKEDFEKFDYILAMDAKNMAYIRALENQAINATYTLMMMRDFDGLGKGTDVPDPYFGGSGGFQDVFDILQRSNERLLDFVIDKASTINS